MGVGSFRLPRFVTRAADDTVEKVDLDEIREVQGYPQLCWIGFQAVPARQSDRHGQPVGPDDQRPATQIGVSRYGSACGDLLHGLYGLRLNADRVAGRPGYLRSKRTGGGLIVR